VPASSAAAQAAKALSSSIRRVKFSQNNGESDEEDEVDEGEVQADFLQADHAARELEIDPEDDEALAAFMPSAAPQRLTLADIILAKIREKETEMASRMSGACETGICCANTPTCTFIVTL